MAEPKVVHATGQHQRVFAKPAETVFALLSEQGKLRSWYGEGTRHDLLEFKADFTVGGELRAVYRFHEGIPFVAGLTMVNAVRYVNIVPNERVVASSVMSMEGQPFSSSLVTYELVPVDGGAELIITHQDAFFENADGPEMRRAGWASLMNRIEQELEAMEAAPRG